MPKPPVAHIQADFIWQTVGSPRESLCTLGFDPTDFGTDSALTMATELDAFVTEVGRPFAAAKMSTEVRYIGTRVTKMMEEGPLSAMFSHVLPGTGVWKIPPNNAAVLIRKVTEAGGRRNRGRMFVTPAGVNEANADATGYMASADLISIQASWTAALNAMIAAGYLPVLFHTESPFTPTPIVSLVVEQQMATQRRRMRR